MEVKRITEMDREFRDAGGRKADRNCFPQPRICGGRLRALGERRARRADGALYPLGKAAVSEFVARDGALSDARFCARRSGGVGSGHARAGVSDGADLHAGGRDRAAPVPQTGVR